MPFGFVHEAGGVQRVIGLGQLVAQFVLLDINDQIRAILEVTAEVTIGVEVREFHPVVDAHKYARIFGQCPVGGGGVGHLVFFGVQGQIRNTVSGAIVYRVGGFAGHHAHTGIQGQVAEVGFPRHVEGVFAGITDGVHIVFEPAGRLIKVLAGVVHAVRADHLTILAQLIVFGVTDGPDFVDFPGGGVVAHGQLVVVPLLGKTQVVAERFDVFFHHPGTEPLDQGVGGHFVTRDGGAGQSAIEAAHGYRRTVRHETVGIGITLGEPEAVGEGPAVGQVQLDRAAGHAAVPAAPLTHVAHFEGGFSATHAIAATVGHQYIAVGGADLSVAGVNPGGVAVAVL